MKQATLIIYRSENGRDGWQPVMPDDVPGWVSNPITLGRLIAGEECMKADEGGNGSAWYRAVKVLSDEDVARIEKAKAKRARRAKHTVH